MDTVKSDCRSKGEGITADSRINSPRWLSSHIPRSQAQLETELRAVLKIVFWGRCSPPSP